jgi:hypothetical protein
MANYTRSKYSALPCCGEASECTSSFQWWFEGLRFVSKRSKKLESIESEDPAFKALCKLLYDMKHPMEVWGVETGLGIASPIWSGIRTNPEELHTLSTKIIQCLSNIGALARFRGFVDHIGELVRLDPCPF